jgi:hypothetical protein
MSHHTATLQSTSATVFKIVCTIADRLYWLDDNYIQPFYTWAAPHLRKVAISGLYWGLVALIDIALWLTNTTLQFMARDGEAIALSAFAQAHDPLPEFPALSPATVPLALLFALPMDPAPDIATDEEVDRVIIIYPTVVPNAFSQFLTPGDSVRRWLTAALPLVPSLTLVEAPVTEAVPVLPSVAEAATVTTTPAPQPRKAKDNVAGKTDAAKTPRKRSPKTKKTATAG